MFRSTENITDISSMMPVLITSSLNRIYTETYSGVGDFYFVVVAGKNGLNSSYSVCVKISVQHLPGAVVGLNFINSYLKGEEEQNPLSYQIFHVKDHNVILNWNSTAGAWIYKIYRDTSPINSPNSWNAVVLS